jgi:hypothetical protein
VNAPSSNTHSIELTGVDGTNPLGFLAALGTLVVARAAGESAARLRWTRSRTWTPVLDDLKSADREPFCEGLAGGLRGKVVSPEADEKRDEADKAHKQAGTAVTNEMKKIKTEKLKGEDRKKAIEERVRPLEAAADAKRSEWLATLKDAVPRPELALGARIDCTGAEYRDHAAEFTDGGDRTSREAIQYLAAFGTDACLEDGKGDRSQRKIEATPFCFIRGSGHQDFLEFVRQLLENVTPERVSEALFEPWVYCDEGLSMRWDPGEDRRYALMDRDPTASDNKARTVWMANLLAYRSLALFPSAPTRRGLGTTAWTTIQGEKAFTWPLWEFAAAPDTVRTLLQLEELRRARLDRSVLDARGISATFRARRIRFPPTGSSYKLNFSPARAV